MKHLWLTLAALAAATVPLLPGHQPPPPPPATWPATWEDRTLRPIAPALEDKRLAEGFPGRIARFSDGRRQVVLRQVAAATRQLHPARDCFAAIGHAIRPLPMRGRATCFEATRVGRRLRVCETITDTGGATYSDVSSWYWAALLGTSTGPWLAATTVERLTPGAAE